MSDVMFYGVLRMPYEIAMADEMSRYQFYSRVQEAVDRVEKAEAKLAAIASQKRGDAKDAEQVGVVCVSPGYAGVGWMGGYVPKNGDKLYTHSPDAPVAQGDAKDALNQAAIGLAALLEGQSNPVKPTIHEYGQASRALIAVRAAIEASQKGGV